MTDPTARVIAHFPDYQDEIESLNEPGSHFNALCHQFDETERELSRLESSTEADAQDRAEQVRKRRAALEQELLAMMQQTQRV